MTTMNMLALPPEHHHDGERIYFTVDQLHAHEEIEPTNREGGAA